MNYQNISLAILFASSTIVPNANAHAHAIDVQLFEEIKSLTSSKQQYIGVGFKLETTNFQFSFSQGAKHASRSDFGANNLQHGTSLNFRIYSYKGNRFKTFFVYDHTSNIFKGKPFNSIEEPTQDFLGFGVLLDHYKNIQPSFSIGLEADDCSKSKGCYPKLSAMFKISFNKNK